MNTNPTDALPLGKLPCGCWDECNPYAHDTAPDWDGTPDGPYYTRCPECDGKIYEEDETKHVCI